MMAFGSILNQRAFNFGLDFNRPGRIDNLNASGTVVQFLSYEGSFKAADGPARNLTSVNIGVSETEATAVGHSLQLKGTGTAYANFSWAAASTSSFGTCNAGQNFPVPDAAPTVTAVSPANGSASVPLDTMVSVTFSEAVTLQAGAITLGCSTSGNVALAVSGGPTVFTADPQATLAPLEDCIVDVVASKVADTDGTPTPMAAGFSAVFTTASAPGNDYYSGVSTGSASAICCARCGASATTPRKSPARTIATRPAMPATAASS